jgi:hypothetical protein
MEMTTSIFSLAAKHRSCYFLAVIFFFLTICIRSDYGVKATAPAHPDNRSSTKKQHFRNKNEERLSKQSKTPFPLDIPKMMSAVKRNMPSDVTCDEDSNAGGGDGEVSIQIIITTDYYPSETSWELRNITAHNNSTGDVLFSSPEGGYEDHDHQYKHTYCVQRNGCYKFIIYDSVGDGMYYGDDDGFEVLLDDNFVSKGGGNFGSSYESNLFGDGCPSIMTLSTISAAPSRTLSMAPSFTPSIIATARSLTPSMVPSLTPSISQSPSVTSDMLSVFTCDESDGDRAPIEIMITTDYYPQETYWDLRNITSYYDIIGDVLFSVPEGAYGSQNHQYKHTYCVERNGCYKFIM